MDVEMEVTVTEAEFTLADVQRVTGFDPEVIRAWRKRNHLPPAERYAKVKTREMASLMVRKLLIDHGFTPAGSWAIADHYASSVLYFAILDTQACSVIGTKAAHAAFQAEFDNNDGFARRFAGVKGALNSLLVSSDGGALEPGELPEITDDSLTGYYINLCGLGRQLYPLAAKPLFNVHVAVQGGDQGAEIQRLYPRKIGHSGDRDD